METLLASQAPPDITALTGLVRAYESGQLMPTPDLLAAIISARQQLTYLTEITVIGEVVA